LNVFYNVNIHSANSQLSQFTLLMGFTMHGKKTIPPIAGNEIQSFQGMLKLISWGVSL